MQARDTEVGLRVSAVARLLGIAPSTLRSWHRRYGIGPSLHLDGLQRRYDADDLARLRRMQAAMLRGSSTADSARHATDEPASAQPDGVDPRPRADSTSDAGSRLGGRVLRLPDGNVLARRLGRAALSMDPGAIRAVLQDAMDELGAIDTWDHVARPVLASIADRWAVTGAGVEAEHLLSECLIRVLDASVVRAPARGPRPVLLACVPGEFHSLPLSALAAVLPGLGVDARLLGAALPEDALRAAVRRTAPAVVVLWAQAPASADLLTTRPRTGQHCRWFAAGPGWTGVPRPPGVDHLSSLREAVQAVSASAETVPAAASPPGWRR